MKLKHMPAKRRLIMNNIRSIRGGSFDFAALLRSIFSTITDGFSAIGPTITETVINNHPFLPKGPKVYIDKKPRPIVSDLPFGNRSQWFSE